jgi:epoxyqueuosine reductase
VNPIAAGELILREGRALGFLAVGIAPVTPAPRHDAFMGWLAAGHAGDMTYLSDPAAVAARRDPASLLAGARTVVAVALAYPGGRDLVPLSRLSGRIARYARGEDYHLVLKARLAELAARIAAGLGRPVAHRACVDSAPLLERDLAAAAGLGFVAKNTMLIAPGLGSWFVLGELLLDVEAHAPQPVAPERPRCGSCRACLDACPTGAFVDAHQLDARRCISYLTIENPGPIPRELRALVGDRIFGCDVCQDVCPFNASGGAPGEPALAPRTPDRGTPDLLAILGLGQAQFRRFVRRSPLRRVHRAQLLRNVCVALGNSGEPAAIPALRRAASVEPPLVRAHAVWALGRLGDRDWLAERRGLETDPTVIGELDAAIV